MTVIKDFNDFCFFLIYCSSGKRRPSSGNDSDSRGSGGGSGTVTENGHNSSGPSWDESTGLAGGCSSNMDCGMGKHGKCGADECTAAFVLVSLSNSPNSPNSMPMRCPHNYREYYKLTMKILDLIFLRSIGLN